MANCTRERKLSFSFNLDLDTVDNETSSDSDATGLQIDVSEVDSFNDTNKLRRQTIDDTSFLNKMEEEIERQLDAKASKTNLTATNVKNILKHVISNEHVMAMVQKRLTKGDDNIIFEPKLTRAKAKELAMTQADIRWPITPVKSTTSDVQILIHEEFSEDSSDEEYHPDQDQQSDDDKDVDNSLGSDVDSQSTTPAIPCNTSPLEILHLSDIQYDKEGIFKLPSFIPHVPTEEESIGHRTRSKLCLSETPLEQIEQAFIPPDITTDMYDWDWEPEDEYINFLKELYTQPLQTEVNVEDDPEADPEYNILEDEETDLLDKEELREDKAVKISKKELKTLIAELDEFADQYTKQQQQQQQQLQQQQKISKKKKTSDILFTSIENISSGNPMVDLLPVLAEPELPELINSDQRYLLSIQMSQHVQLMVQQYLMTYKHPKWSQQSKICKNNLYSLSTLGDKSDSEFIAENLSDAFHLLLDWELKLSDSKFLQEYISYLQKEAETEEIIFRTKKKYITKFHPELIKLMAHSRALMHPQLLPSTFVSALSQTSKQPYLSSEDNLIALGLEQFIPHVKMSSKKFNRQCDIFADAVKEIQRFLIPTKSVTGLIHHINKSKSSKKQNSIKYYFTTGSAPKIGHHVLSEYKLLSPIEQPTEFLPIIWQDLIDTVKYGKIEDFLLFSKPQKEKVINYDDEFLPVSYDEIIIHRDHQLRNPIVNMFKHMPSLITSQKVESSNSLSKTTSKNTIATLSRTNETESDAESAESLRTCETDEDELRPTRLRRTTPRLAKIKSVQNMKLLAQNLSPKTSTLSNNIIENKDYAFDKNDDDASSFIKGDNEDEIAELMLASTTIKKNTASRKKTKQARELENLKRLLEVENNINEEERATKFAASFIQKIHVKLESKDPELFKTVLKIFLDYSEKLENPTQSNDCFLNDTSHPDTNIIMKIEKNLDRDKLSLDLYEKVCKKLYEYPDLCSDFLLFLTPHQAALINKSVDHTMMLKMKEFVNVTQMYFAKQPSRIAKVMQAMTQMASDPYVSVEIAQNIMGVALKGHPLIMDMFLQVLPNGKPPDSLFAAHMFENLSCPVGPHDKNKAYDIDAPELYENIELPVFTPQEDPYGGDSCKCNCHSIMDDSKLKGMNDHCASCGTRFLNGRIYLQTSEGLRPAKITFPGADDEKFENISRVSLKTTERFVPCPPTRKRRKASKRDSISEESNLKPCSSKSSPTKDNEDSDRSVSKSKKSIKSPSKSTDHKIKLPKIQSTSVKSKREKRTEKKHIRFEQRTDDEQNEFNVGTDKIEFYESTDCNTNEDYVELDTFGNKFGEISTDSHEDDTMTSPDKINISSTSVDKLDVSTDSDSSTNLETEKSLDPPWTMQDDKVLLQNVQKDYSEKTFLAISLLLKNRTVGQVKERCEYLLSLIEKMA